MNLKINTFYIISTLLCFYLGITYPNINVYAQCSGATASTTVIQGSIIKTASSGHNTTAGYLTLYVLTEEATGIIIASNTTGDFDTGNLTTGMNYQIHALNYDVDAAPSALPLTVGDHINAINDGCFNVDFQTEYLCITVTALNCVASQTICAGDVLQVATTGANATADYTTLYVLVHLANNQVVASNITGTFTNDVVANNTYQIHALNYETANAPSALPLNAGDHINAINDGCFDPNFTTEYLCVIVDMCPPSCPTPNSVDGSAQVCVAGSTELADWQAAVMNANAAISGAIGPSYSSVPTTANNFPQPIANAIYDGDHCIRETETTYAYYTCDATGAILTAGTYTLIIYPDINQQNNVVIDDGGCCPSLQLQCPTTYSYTNTLDNTTGDPDCTNEQGTGSFKFLLQLNNAPNLGNMACTFVEIDAEYDCCEAEAGMLTNTPLICPQSNFTVQVSGQNPDVDYSNWLIITDADGNIVAPIAFDGNTSLAIPYADWAIYLGYGLDYQFYSFNVNNQNLPAPDQITANNIADIGTEILGCFDLSDPISSYIPQDFASISINTSEGNEGGVTPFHYNTHGIAFSGGTPPYRLDWERIGYVRQHIRFFNDGYNSELDALVVSPDPGMININPGGFIEIIYSDQAIWQVTITDANGCTHPTWQLTNDPTVVGGDQQILDIYEHNITGTTDAVTENGAITIAVEGGCPPYTYQWTGPFGFSATTEDLTNLHYGWYVVSITDAGGSTACPDDDAQSTIGWYWVPKHFNTTMGGFIRGKEVAIPSTHLVTYPNPLETTTTVVFRTTETIQTTIDLYGIDGRKVKEVFRGITKAQQAYQLSLNAKQLVNGIYILQLITATGEQQQQKLLIAH